MEMILIKTFMYPHEAHLAKGKLEAQDIACELRDELTVQINNFYSNAIGGVKLLVSEVAVEQAIEILEADYSSDLEIDKVSYPNIKACSFCGSSNVSDSFITGNWALLSTLLMGFPLPFVKMKAKCFGCGEEF
jgi:hypothetical protein